jgi:hypothetical protein
MFVRLSHRLGLLALAVVALLLGQADLSQVQADQCNNKKAVTIGCPIAQQSCADSGCQNGVICASSVCWQTVQFYNGRFRCDPVNPFEAIQFDGKWMCYQEFTVGPLGIMPVTQVCLDIVYCTRVGFVCGPDNTRPDTKVSFVYGTSHTCDKPS